MNLSNHQRVFSSERLQKYLDLHNNDHEKALKHYKANILLSESFYPMLSIFEIALRNSLNRELCAHFLSQDWHLAVSGAPGLKNLQRDVTVAYQHIQKRGEQISSPKVVAELTLGFWVRLFNTEYDRVLWKNLRKSFPFIPKHERQRHAISMPLNKIRNFRNRVYHNEPVSWNFERLEQIHSELMKVMGWLNKDLPAFAETVSRFNEVMRQVKIDMEG